MGVQLRTPDERECEVCGRAEVWDAADQTWRIREDDGEAQVGNVYCIHEWDINGAFRPISG